MLQKGSRLGKKHRMEAGSWCRKSIFASLNLFLDSMKEVFHRFPSLSFFGRVPLTNGSCHKQKSQPRL